MHFSEFLATYLSATFTENSRVPGMNKSGYRFRRLLRSRLSKMNEAKSFLRDLDEAVLRGTAESRLRALWHTTDLMIAGQYSDDEIWTFGEVIGRLADEIEVAARAELAKRLARFDKAPVNIIHKLAFDDSIDVAGPVLQESERLET